MKTKHDYFIVSEDNGKQNDFENSVKYYLNNGWSLVGGLVIYNGCLCQAVTRSYEEEKSNYEDDFN